MNRKQSIVTMPHVILLRPVMDIHLSENESETVYSDNTLRRFYRTRTTEFPVDKSKLLEYVSIFDRNGDFDLYSHSTKQYTIYDDGSEREIVCTEYTCSRKSEKYPNIIIIGYGNTCISSLKNVYETINRMELYILGRCEEENPWRENH